MNSIEIKCARVRKRLSAKQMANMLNVNETTYRARENGRGSFSDSEKVKMAEIFGWDYDQMNEYLYDGILPARVV